MAAWRYLDKLVCAKLRSLPALSDCGYFGQRAAPGLPLFFLPYVTGRGKARLIGGLRTVGLVPCQQTHIFAYPAAALPVVLTFVFVFGCVCEGYLVEAMVWF